MKPLADNNWYVTFSDRINVVSGVSTFQDNAKLTFGAQSDLIVYHSGT